MKIESISAYKVGNQTFMTLDEAKDYLAGVRSVSLYNLLKSDKSFNGHESKDIDALCKVIINNSEKIKEILS